MKHISKIFPNDRKLHFKKKKKKKERKEKKRKGKKCLKVVHYLPK